MTLLYGSEATGQRTGPGLPSENYWFRRHVAAYRYARTMVRGVVLDAGAGEGYGASILARRARAIGLEIDGDTVSHAAARYRAVRFVRADVGHLPVAAGSVDAVVALQVLEHLDRPEGFLRGCVDVLRPGGTVVLSTPNGPTFPAGNPWHVHEFEAAELGDLLASTFGLVRLLGVRHGRGLSLLDRFLGESVQHRLARDGYADQPAWLRAILRTVTSRDFRLSERAGDCLDLFAVAEVR